MTSSFVNTGLDATRYSSASQLPTSAPNGALAVTLDTGFLYEYNANTPGWQQIGGAGGGVTSINGETGSVNIVAGTGITVTPAGQNITIASTGSAVWGQITGTLSNQTDLQNALNLKAPLASPTFTGVVNVPKGTAFLPLAGGSLTGNVPSIEFPSDGFGAGNNGFCFFPDTDVSTDTISSLNMVLEGITCLAINYDSTALAATVVACGNLFPTTKLTNGTVDLGNAAAYWHNLFTKRLNVSPTSTIGATGNGAIMVVNGGLLFEQANNSLASPANAGIGFSWVMDSPDETLNELAVAFQYQSSTSGPGTGPVGGLIRAADWEDAISGVPQNLIVRGGSAVFTGSAVAGADLYLQGGFTKATNQKGGVLHLAGGAGAGTGSTGIVKTESGSGSTYNYSTPTTGGTVSIPATVSRAIIDPAGTLAALTVNLPVAVDGQVITFGISQIITAVTVTASGGATVNGALTGTLGANAFATYQYKSSNTTWYRMG